MHGSDRRIIVAAFGWLILAAQAPSSERMASPSPAPEQQSSKQTNGKYRPAEQSALPIRIVQGEADAEDAKAREAKSEDHDSKDLKAQIRAADAAEQQIFPSWLAAILSFMGTGLIVWTLIETGNYILDVPFERVDEMDGQGSEFTSEAHAFLNAETLARALDGALRKSQNALVMGHVEERDTVVDGHFDLFQVATDVIMSLGAAGRLRDNSLA